MFSRRQFLELAAATAGVAATGFSGAALAQQGLKLGPAEPFSFDALKRHAQEIAQQPYVPPPPTARSSSRPTWRSGPTARAGSR